MTKEVIGDACAYIPGARPGDKTRYPRIGLAMQDNGRISLKLDSLPLPGTGWTGWIYIFPRQAVDSRDDSNVRNAGQSRPLPMPDFGDDSLF